MEPLPYIFEVCLDSVHGAIEAEKGGATRIELCANLIEGGTTPSLAMVQECLAQVNLDVRVIVRPRGGDFLYSAEELAVMKQDILLLKEAGVKGVVIGLLKENGQVDKAQTATLIDAARPMEITFHRAFDVSRDPFEALEDLIDLGVERILTSGQKGSVPEGIEMIRLLVERANGRIKILPGAGIQPEHVGMVLTTGVTEFHATAWETIESGMHFKNPEVYMGLPGLGEYERKVTSHKEVKRYMDAIREYINKEPRP
ncbi:MAG: copper homeostasis protein CutC [Bacteroidota bacterium]